MLDIDNTMSHQALGLSDEQVDRDVPAMVLARRVDDRMWALNRQGRVPFVVSVAGHEGVQVGAAFALDTSRDWSLPYYRDIAFNLALGFLPKTSSCPSSPRRATPQAAAARCRTTGQSRTATSSPTRLLSPLSSPTPAASRTASKLRVPTAS